jgi:hypothetical protein
MGKVIKSAFILHSYPMLYSPECLPFLEEKENFYCLIPTEELALLNNVKWPVLIDHVDETVKENIKGYTVSKIIDTGFLFCDKIEIDKSKCTIQEIKNFRQWDETSTSYSSSYIKLEQPYEFIDTNGVIGQPGQSYLISYHVVDIQPLHLAIVEYGRTGYKGKLREPVEKVANAIAKSLNTDILQENNSKILTYNSSYKEHIQDMATEKKTDNKEEKKTENKSSENMEDSKNTDNAENASSMDYKAMGESVANAVASAMAPFFNGLSSKIDKLMSEEMEDDEEMESMNKDKSCNKKADKKQTTKNSSPDDTDEDDEDLEDDEDDTEDDVEEKTSNSIELAVQKALNKVLHKVGASTNSASESENDPYESFSNRWNK